VVIDNFENAKALNDAAKACQKTLTVLIDIDPGIGRTGIPYEQVLNFAKALSDLPHLKFSGIQCYAGNLQHIPNYKTREEASLEAMQKAAACLRELNQANIPCDILTGSGTGTYAIDLDVPEITEIQPGSYAVMDTEYYEIGLRFKPAMTLLTTIISANHKDHVTCDAGWKALYQVPTKPTVLDPQNLEYDWGGFGDEHGKIRTKQGGQLPKLGSLLTLMVAHCDPTINLFDQFYIMRNNEVIDIWPIDLRGKSQ
ncbi:MAG: alanine racemase, partial [Coxiellaceae bacterium]|nr:alanine racemase [Coxiellaceae bacterium]